MGDDLDIPERPEELTPAWLTSALRAGGVLRTASVVSVERTVLGEGAGFIGQIARISLAYDAEEPGAPATLIAKMPSLDQGARTIAALYGMYERELNFYRDLAADVTFRIPRLYHGSGDAERVRYVLLLEDMAASGEMGDQVAGCSADHARLALEHLAVHHAAWWRSPKLGAVPWLQDGIDLVNGAMTMVYPSVWEKARGVFGDRMSVQIRDAMPDLGRRVMVMAERYRNGPLTIAHGDYRLDNMFFGRPGADYELAVLDWQSPNRGWGAYDIAYFMYGNLDIDTRRSVEVEVLRRYHAILLERGVTEYPWDQLVDDYVASLVVSLGIWVVNAATLDTANERGLALFELFFERLNAAIMDHDALSRLPA